MNLSKYEISLILSALKWYSKCIKGPYFHGFTDDIDNLIIKIEKEYYD